MCVGVVKNQIKSLPAQMNTETPHPLALALSKSVVSAVS